MPWEKNFVRLTYFDDAGLFDPQKPFIVAGAVMVDADQQMIAVEDYLGRLVQKHIPEEDQDGFVFHAMDLWHGGPYFVRDKWPLAKRLEILADLAAIPEKFDLLVTFGYQDRTFIPRYQFPESTSDKDKELVVYADVVARLCETVEKFMREIASKEVALLIAEDRDTVRSRLKEAHNLYRDHNRMKKANPMLRYFPFHHIRDALHFAKKNESAHLQIADVCTFVISRRLQKCSHIPPLYFPIKRCLLVLPPGENDEDVP
jgi:hypothetical protein